MIDGENISPKYREFDSVGEFGLHARNTANPRSKRAWFWNSPTLSNSRSLPLVFHSLFTVRPQDIHIENY